MFMNEYFIVFPEGDVQEISRRIPVNEIVDINGNSLPLPLPTSRVIAYRVSRIKTNENRGGNETFHFLELLSAEELIPYTQAPGVK
ncbi:MAG: hypothetical protein LBE14_08875 [Treponema sp.]|jgi:hypothetical protein|nr:hypothetical protein [Treponema sp.]